jgi:hypothetical protein
MAKRTQIVCLHEGEKGHSIDPLFIRRLIKSLNPSWIRPQGGSNLIRPVDCGGRSQLIKRMPEELRACLQAGGEVTLMVWADVDSDPDPEALKKLFWEEAQSVGISPAEFEQVVFVLPKYRIENWIEFLHSGSTDEGSKGPRVKDRQATDAARLLADRCEKQRPSPKLPPSLEWSCRNWKALVARLKP